MSRLKHAKKVIEQLSLSTAELMQLKVWLTEFANSAWDKQIEHDSLSGKLDALIQKAREEDTSGKTKPLR